MMEDDAFQWNGKMIDEFKVVTCQYGGVARQVLQLECREGSDVESGNSATIEIRLAKLTKANM